MTFLIQGEIAIHRMGDDVSCLGQIASAVPNIVSRSDFPRLRSCDAVLHTCRRYFHSSECRRSSGTGHQADVLCHPSTLTCAPDAHCVSSPHRCALRICRGPSVLWQGPAGGREIPSGQRRQHLPPLVRIVLSDPDVYRSVLVRCTEEKSAFVSRRGRHGRARVFCATCRSRDQLVRGARCRRQIRRLQYREAHWWLTRTVLIEVWTTTLDCARFWKRPLTALSRLMNAV